MKADESVTLVFFIVISDMMKQNVYEFPNYEAGLPPSIGTVRPTLETCGLGATPVFVLI